MSEPQSRIANSTEAVRRHSDAYKQSLSVKLRAEAAIDHADSAAFVARWRNGLREEVLARHTGPYIEDWRRCRPLPRLVASNGARVALGHMPWFHPSCAAWIDDPMFIESGASRAGSALPTSPGTADDGEGRLAFSPSPSIGGS